MSITKSNKSILIFLIIIAYHLPTYSCSTPVFRYALEMWAAYSYRIEVVYDGELTGSEQEALDYLKKSSFSNNVANIEVFETKEVGLNSDNTKRLPRIKLFFPDEHKIPEIIWEGDLTEENVKRIIDSPTRKQIFENIKKGDAAVWLFLNSGNVERDTKQFKILQEELLSLSKKLKLSPTATDVAGNPLDINFINTGVSFSLIQLDKNDPAEAIFIEILLRTESDLRMFKNVPLAFPIFGQGRTLYALAGNGINAKNVETACSSIIGWCSCTIKDDNPGTDLLLTADWDKAIGDISWIKKEEIPDITGVSEYVVAEEEKINNFPVEETEEKIVVEAIEEKPETKKVEVGETEESNLATNKLSSSIVNNENPKSWISPLWRNSLIALMVLIVIIFSTSFIMKRKQG